jgi:hypothetical protein
LQDIELAILEEGGAWGGADATRCGQDTADGGRREPEGGAAAHDAAPGEPEAHRFVD